MVIRILSFQPLPPWAVFFNRFVNRHTLMAILCFATVASHMLNVRIHQEFVNDKFVNAATVKWKPRGVAGAWRGLLSALSVAVCDAGEANTLMDGADDDALK